MGSADVLWNRGAMVLDIRTLKSGPSPELCVNTFGSITVLLKGLSTRLGVALLESVFMPQCTYPQEERMQTNMETDHVGLHP